MVQQNAHAPGQEMGLVCSACHGIDISTLQKSQLNSCQPKTTQARLDQNLQTLLHSSDVLKGIHGCHVDQGHCSSFHGVDPMLQVLHKHCRHVCVVSKMALTHAIDPVTNFEIASSRSCVGDNTDVLVQEVILIKSTRTETQVLPVQTDSLQLDLNPILLQRLPELSVWPEVKGGENFRSLEGCMNRTKTAQ